MTAQQFRKAIRLIDDAISRSFVPSPKLFVQKGICIQLDDYDCPYTLSDARKCFEMALEIDAEYIDAHIELAFFLLNVEDKTPPAEKHFHEAKRLIERRLLDLENACQDKPTEVARQSSQSGFLARVVTTITRGPRTFTPTVTHVAPFAAYRVTKMPAKKSRAAKRTHRTT